MSTLADVRCPVCFRSGMRRDDGSLKPHLRRTALTLAGWTLDTAILGHAETWRDPSSGRSMPRPYALRRVRADAESERAAAAGCGGAS